MKCHDFSDPNLKSNRVEAAGSGCSSPGRALLPRYGSLARRARQDGDLSTPLNAPPPVQSVSTPPPHPHTRWLWLEPPLSVAWFLCTFGVAAAQPIAPVDTVCPTVPEYSGPRRAMILPAGTPETSLLRVLFLGLSTLGESNTGSGRALIRLNRTLGRTLGSGSEGTFA